MVLHTQPEPEGYPAKGYQFFGGDGPSLYDNDDNADVGENEEHSPSGSTVDV